MSDKMREEFEAWARSAIPGLMPFYKYNSGDYRDESLQRYWIGWQASRESLVIELPKGGNMWDDEPIEIKRSEAVAAIEAAGLKVKP